MLSLPFIEIGIALLTVGVYTGFSILTGFIMGRLTRESDLKDYIMPKVETKAPSKGQPVYDEDPWEEALLPPKGERIPTIGGKV